MVIASSKEFRYHPPEMEEDGKFNHILGGHLHNDLGLVIGQIESTPGVQEDGSDQTGDVVQTKIRPPQTSHSGYYQEVQIIHICGTKDTAYL